MNITLNKAKEMINELAIHFGWGNTEEHIATKIYYAMIELGEAGDAWKHRGDEKYLFEELNIVGEEELADHIIEELIDAIFYCLHGIHCVDPNRNVDDEFMKKWKINSIRGRTYLDDSEK
jgi:NTP pyrophosphatase (non-canonical NTP hydrolase)